MKAWRRGHCLCGRVEVVLRAAPLMVAACHCTHCRRSGGGAFSLVAIVPAPALEVTGELSVYADVAESGMRLSRRFCGGCGSPVETVSAVTERQGVRIVKLGLFDTLDDLRPVAELFCRSRVHWLSSIDGAQSFAAMPPAHDPARPEQGDAP